MFNNDILKSALLAIPAGLPSIGGAIGSATTTVDLASSFLITQTVAMTATATLPNPSDPRAGDRANVGNSPVSTQNVLINGSTLTPGHFAEFLWSGTAWLVTQVASISSGFTDDFVPSLNWNLAGDEG